MKMRLVRIRLEFTIELRDGIAAKGLDRVGDFIAAGLQEVLTAGAFPIDVLPGAKLTLLDPDFRRARKKKAPKRASA